MINRLRKRIFWIIQISLSIIVLGVIVLFSILNYRNTIKSSVVFMDRFENRDARGDRPRELNENIDGVYRLEVNNTNVTSRSNEVTDEIKEYAIKASNSVGNEGIIGKYIYSNRSFGPGVKEITLVESENTIRQLNITMLITIIVGVSGLIAIYIIAKEISKIIVKPVAESFDKQKQFVSDASHELKTPLAVIEANADVLQSKVGENKWLTYIQNEVQSMNKLVNDLLTLARMENVDSNNQVFDLSKEVQMSIAVFESMIYENKIELETNIAEGIEFKGEKEDIKHIISIILDNAIKHTKEKGKIIVDVSKEKNSIKIEIKNQGDPIPEEEREKIFERFYRVDKARNRNEKRYGLGLSIAKGIVEKYNGTIEANSKDGFTSFIIKI